MRRIKSDPINREILRALARTRMRVTPSQISRAAGIHPATAKSRLNLLRERRLIESVRKGNRTYIKPIDIEAMKRKMKRDFFR